MEQCDGQVIINEFEPQFKNPPDEISYHCIESRGNLYCNKKPSVAPKKPAAMPNEMYISLNSESLKSAGPTRNDKLDLFSCGCHSTPASPDDTERNRHVRKDLMSFHSPIIDKKLPFSFSSSFVRTSKSEDHLRKSSLTTVNIDIEDELASSLDTLLDTNPADDVFYCLERDEGLNCSCPEAVCRDCNSYKSDLSPSSSEKVSVKAGHQVKDTSRHSEPLSGSSGSEIIPSDSSTTIRRGDSDDCECTSDQISAISSLDGATDVSRSTDSDLGSPVESLSPEVEMDAWNGDIDSNVFHDITNVNKAVGKKHSLCNESNSNGAKPHFSEDAFKPTPPSEDAFRSSLAVPKASEDMFDVSTESLTSPLSDNTFGDLSYHELTESYDEVSATLEEVAVNRRSESPTTTDDESDIESLHSFHYSPKAVDIPSAVRLAKRLFALDGFKKTDVSRHLSKNNDFNKVVAEEYSKLFEFYGEGLDVALRKFLNQFCLVGETQERERVLFHFSKRFLDCNPNTFKSIDAVHTLTCALMLLNSDLHGENVRRKMVCGEFVQNLAELNDGEDYPRDVLKTLYHSIKAHPLEWAIDQEDDKKHPSKEKSSSNDYRQSFSYHNPFLEVPNPNCATEYKKGYVMRKCCMDPSGKKTALGKRSWKMLYATLRDLVLYLHKDEHGFKKNQLYESLHNSIRIHHAYAEKAIDYTKKQYVFRLHTADQAVYLFQTSDSKELESWVDTINLVAASLSAPPLPCGIGFQRKFQRPLLPVSHTKLNLREQLQDHETRIVWLEKEYEEFLLKTPEKSLKSRFTHEFTEKETHLQNELTRYRTYAFLLRTRMAQYPELETPLVQTSIGEVEEPSEKSSPSPSKKSTEEKDL